MANVADGSLLRGPLAGFLSWLVPGLGHMFLGQKGRGLILLATITATFWAGVAIGGVRNTVDPRGERKLWFAAQVCTGGNALSALALRNAVAGSNQPRGTYLSSEVGVHFTGVAGLLNILIILDAITRGEFVGASAGRSRRPPRSTA